MLKLTNHFNGTLPKLVKVTSAAMVTTLLCLLPSVAKADMRVQIPVKRHCKPYSVTYAYNKKESFPVYVLRLQAGQRFEVHNMDEYVSLVTLIDPQGKQAGDFLMSAGEVASTTVSQTGDYKIQLASDKDYYDLRFCAY